MTKKDTLLTLAQELKELKDLYWEISADLKQAGKDGNDEEIERYTRWRTKTFARMNQTVKIAELLGLSPQKLDNLAFELSVQESRKAL